MEADRFREKKSKKVNTKREREGRGEEGREGSTSGSGEGEHGKRHGDGDVDADLADVNLVRELPGSSAGVGEEGSAVSVRVLVDEGDGLIKGVNVQANKGGSEDLLSVAGHLRGDFSEDGGSKEVALLKARDADTATIEQELSTLVDSRLDEVLSTLLGLQRENTTNI